MKAQCFVLVFIWSFMSLACQNTVNETIHIGDGETTRGDMNSVNGGIIIGKNCSVKGTARTVNGAIRVGEQSSIEGLQSVNGSIEVSAGTSVSGDIGSVNGSVSCSADVEISGEIGTVNGSVKLEKATVGENIKTANGSITLSSGTRVLRDIIIENDTDNRDNADKNKVIVISVKDGSVVEGDVVVKQHYRPVEVHLSGGGKVLGEINGARVVGGESI